MTNHVSNLLQSSNGDWGDIVKTVQAIREIRAWVHDALPETLREHCQVGHFQTGILTLVASSPARATQLRFMTWELLQSLRQFPQWAHIRSIQVKVESLKPTQIVPDPVPEARAITLNDCAADALLETAANIDTDRPGNEALKAALERLAERREKTDS